jgi:NAD(P)-dependent dehydrogenase (short-subunit alcohol dehydrogenase family)
LDDEHKPKEIASQARAIDLIGKVAVVTGASRGIGRVIAQHLAGAGATVALFARSAVGLDETSRLIEQAGGRAWKDALDVTDLAAVEDGMRRVRVEVGAVDLLINNAGVGGPTAPISEVDPDEWWRTIEINLRGYFLFQRAVLPDMLGRHAGRIVNIASNAGVHRWPWKSAYSVSKAAGIKLVENLAVEVRKEGIAVFAFHPGLVMAGLTDQLFTGEMPEPGSMDERIYAWFMKQIDAGEVSSADQVADFVLALASGRYDALSGRYLTIDDDLDGLLARIDEVQGSDLLMLRLRQ